MSSEISPDLVAQVANRLFQQDFLPPAGSLAGPSAAVLPAGAVQTAGLPRIDKRGLPQSAELPGNALTAPPLAPRVPSAQTSLRPQPQPELIPPPITQGLLGIGSELPHGVPQPVTGSSPLAIGDDARAMTSAAGPSQGAELPRGLLGQLLRLRPDVPALAGFSLPLTSVPESGISTGSSFPVSPAAAGVPSFGGMPGVPATAPGMSQPQPADDGLKRFVAQVRRVPLQRDRGLCLNEDSPTVGLRPIEAESLHVGQTASSGTPAVRGSRNPSHSSGSAVSHGGSRPLDVNQIRSEFPVLQQTVNGRPLAWFDNAATTQKPQAVIDRLSRFYAEENSNIHRGAHTLAARATDAYEGARQTVQRFLGASSTRDIVFVRGTTEGINLAATIFGQAFLQPDDEILLSQIEHHANIVPWQMIAKATGARLRVIPVNDRGEVLQSEYAALLGPKTRMVALTQASNSLGTVLPVAEMTALAKRHGAKVLIDGAQSVSHMPINVQEIGCDFFVFSGHKLFAPTGIGVVYITPELQDVLPPWQGGGNMIRDVTFEETQFQEAPARFEAGTPSIADAVGLGAAIDYVSRIGLPAIGRYEHELLEHATAELARIRGLRIIGTAANKVSLVSFTLPNRSPEQIGRMLDQEGIAVRAGHHCAQPSLRRFGVEATVRPSFAFYNTHEEIERLITAVRRIAVGSI